MAPSSWSHCPFGDCFTGILINSRSLLLRHWEGFWRSSDSSKTAVFKKLQPGEETIVTVKDSDRKALSGCRGSSPEQVLHTVSRFPRKSEVQPGLKGWVESGQISSPDRKTRMLKSGENTVFSEVCVVSWQKAAEVRQVLVAVFKKTKEKQNHKLSSLKQQTCVTLEILMYRHSLAGLSA